METKTITQCPLCGEMHESSYDGEICIRCWAMKRQMFAHPAAACKIGICKELLEALKMAVRALEDHNIDESMAGEFEILTDALAKAESEV